MNLEDCNSYSSEDDSYHYSYADQLAAIKDNNLELLIDIYHRTGSKGNTYTYDTAARLGNLEIIKFLLSKPCVYAYEHYYMPIECKQLHIVKYLIEIGITYTIHDLIHAANCDHDIFLELLSNDITKYKSHLLSTIIASSKLGDNTLDTVKKIVKLLEGEEDYKDPYNMYIAFDVGSLEIIKFLHENGFPYNNSLYEVCYSDIEILKYLYEVMDVKNEPEDMSAIEYCVISGNVECFEYMVSKGFLVTKEAITSSLYTGHISMVKYLHENKYEWDENFEIDDIGYDGVDKYCHDNNIPKDWKCESKCSICLEKKIQLAKDMWQIEGCDNVVQWLPRGMLEALLNKMK